jgi:hypothetical protein
VSSIQSNRIKNLKALIKKHGSAVELSKATNTYTGYFSHVIGGRRNLGDKLARRIEDSLGLQTGWMDKSH